MPCSRCSECRDNGQRFCIYCGEFIGDDCERCEESRRSGARFCVGCGRPLFERPQPPKIRSTKETLLHIGFIVGVVVTVLWSLYLIFELLTALFNFGNVFEHLADFSSDLIIVIPKVTSFWTLEGTGLQIYWILLVLALVACLGYLFYKAIGPAKKLINEKDTEPLKNTALFEVCVLFCALYFLEFMFTLVLLACGVDMGTLPDRPDWQWMFDLLEAPVWEEIITRILYLGVPMAVYYAIRKKKGAWKCIIGGFEIDRVALIFIVFSAFMFAAGHLTNWGTWKFFPTFAFGLIAGYLFCKYGVYATVAIHFLTDYIEADKWVLGTQMISVMLLLVTMLACAPYVYTYMKKGVTAVVRIVKEGH